MNFVFRLRHPVLILFGIYLFQAFAFAKVYQWLHKADPSALLFNTAISERQLELDKARDTEILSEINADLRVFEIARTFPAKIRQLSKTPARRIPRDRIVLNYEQDGVHMDIWWQMGGLKDEATVELSDERRRKGFEYKKKINTSEDFYDDHLLPQSVEGAARVVEEFDFYFKEEIGRLRLEASRAEQRLKRVEKGEPSWEFTEYFYFSVTSVVGGAYGDILPNSRTVRKVIILQFLISVSIIGFLVSIAARPS